MEYLGSEDLSTVERFETHYRFFSSLGCNEVDFVYQCGLVIDDEIGTAIGCPDFIFDEAHDWYVAYLVDNDRTTFVDAFADTSDGSRDAFGNELVFGTVDQFVETDVGHILDRMIA